MRGRVAQHGCNLLRVLEEVFGQQRDHFVPHDIVHIGPRCAVGELGMPDLVFAIVEVLDPLVDRGKDTRQVELGCLSRLGQHG